MGVFSWLTGSDKAVAACRRRAADFLVEDGVTTFSMGDFHIEVDKEKQLIVINHSIKLTPNEFSWCRVLKTVVYSGSSGGYTHTINTSNGGVGSVYIPGQYTPGGSYDTTVGVKFIRLTENQQRDIKLFKYGGEREISSKTSVNMKSVFECDFSKKSEWEYVLFECNINSKSLRVGILHKVAKWCDAVVNISDQKTALSTLDSLRDQAGLDDDNFHIIKWAEGGVITSLVAADRAGKVVLKSRADSWMGSLRGASAQIVDNELDVKVDDPVYREQKLSERHFIILGGEPRDVLVAWEERINLLANKLADSAPS